MDDHELAEDRRVLNLWGRTFHLEERGLAIDEVVPYVTQLNVTVDQLTRRVSELESQAQQQTPGLALGQLPLWGRRFSLVEAGMAVDETVPFIAELMSTIQALREQLEVNRRRLDRVEELERLAEAKLLESSRIRLAEEPTFGLLGEATPGPGTAEVSPLQAPLPLMGAPDPADRAEADAFTGAEAVDAEVAEILPDRELPTSPAAEAAPEMDLSGQKVTIEDHPAAVPPAASPEDAPGTITAADVAAAAAVTAAREEPPAPAPADAPDPAALDEQPAAESAPPVAVPTPPSPAPAEPAPPEQAPAPAAPAPSAAPGTYQGEVVLRFSPAASIADVIRIQETLGRVPEIQGLVSVTRPSPGQIACIVRVLDAVPLVDILNRQPGFSASAAGGDTIDIALS